VHVQSIAVTLYIHVSDCRSVCLQIFNQEMFVYDKTFSDESSFPVPFDLPLMKYSDDGK